jgi:hypothetical protein
MRTRRVRAVPAVLDVLSLVESRALLALAGLVVDVPVTRERAQFEQGEPHDAKDPDENDHRNDGTDRASHASSFR